MFNAQEEGRRANVELRHTLNELVEQDLTMTTEDFP
jgi:hypothetical protein